MMTKQFKMPLKGDYKRSLKYFDKKESTMAKELQKIQDAMIKPSFKDLDVLKVRVEMLQYRLEMLAAEEDVFFKRVEDDVFFNRVNGETHVVR